MDTHRHWIKNLAYQEDQMEKKGEVAAHSSKQDLSPKVLENKTADFLKQLRLAFSQHVAYFNQLKGYFGSIRIYGIAQTQSDFMLFRSGCKLIFSMKEPGLISIRFSNADDITYSQKTYIPVDYIKAAEAPFGEVKWTYSNHDIKVDYLIRYYLTQFVKQSIHK